MALFLDCTAVPAIIVPQIVWGEFSGYSCDKQESWATKDTVSNDDGDTYERCDATRLAMDHCPFVYLPCPAVFTSYFR